MGEQSEQSVVGPAEPGPAEPGYTVLPRSTKSRANQTVRDLVLSMLVVGLFVAFLYIMVLRPTPDPIRVVDVAGPASQAQVAGVFDVLVPVLPEGWRATSARLSAGPTEDTGQWYNGYISPTGEFLAVVQQDYDLADFVKTHTQAGTPQGTVEIAGQQWTRYSSPGASDRSLVRQGADGTVVVTGTVTDAALEQFAASLRSASAS
jgi:hypothetical protein